MVLEKTELCEPSEDVLMKTIIARKCKNEWLVEIKDTRYLKTKGEVLKLVRENGLRVFKGAEENLLPVGQKGIYAE